MMFYEREVINLVVLVAAFSKPSLEGKTRKSETYSSANHFLRNFSYL